MTVARGEFGKVAKGECGKVARGEWGKVARGEWGKALICIINIVRKVDLSFHQIAPKKYHQF